MPTSIDKLHTLRDQLDPLLEELMGGGGDLPMVAQMGLAFVRPQVETYVDQFLTRDPADVDAALIAIVDAVAKHLSDDVAPFAVGPRGADLAAGVAGYVDDVDDGGPEQLADPVRASDPAGGGDPVGQVAPGPAPVPVGSGTAAGDRPG